MTSRPYLVERDGRPDLLTAVDHAAGHEVAHRTVLRRGEGARAAVGDGLRVRAGPAAAAPVVAVVAVEVGADRRSCPGVGWRFLRQWWNRPPEMSYSAPSGLTTKTIQISRVFTIERDARVDAVAVDQPVEDVQRHLGRHVLVGVVSAVEHDLGFGLVDRDVVGDLDRPDVAALVALADREAGDDRRDGPRRRRRPPRSPRCSCGSPPCRAGTRSRSRRSWPRWRGGRRGPWRGPAGGVMLHASSMARAASDAIHRTGQPRPGQTSRSAPGPIRFARWPTSTTRWPTIDTWGAEHAAAAVVAAGRRPRDARRPAARLPLGVGHQARHGVDRADRRGPGSGLRWTRRPVRPGRPSGISWPTRRGSSSRAR